MGTQFTRALDALGIALICANSPQAKGRLERANGVLQDRFIKAMRLDGISGMQAGNEYAKTYMKDNPKMAYEIEDKIRAAHGLDFDMPPPSDQPSGDDAVVEE